MGAASFAELQDSYGKIQLYIKRDDICQGEDKTMYNTVFKKLLDIGDIIGVKGFVFVTQMGEISIHVKEINILCKSVKPLPVVKEKDGKVVSSEAISMTKAAQYAKENYAVVEYDSVHGLDKYSWWSWW